MPLSDQEKENIIAQALSTPEGRLALACSMVPPIQEGLELFGTYDHEPTREMALDGLSRYEKNIAKGKTYDKGIVDSIHDIYICV